MNSDALKIIKKELRGIPETVSVNPNLNPRLENKIIFPITNVEPTLTTMPFTTAISKQVKVSKPKPLKQPGSFLETGTELEKEPHFASAARPHEQKNKAKAKMKSFLETGTELKK